MIQGYEFLSRGAFREAEEFFAKHLTGQPQNPELLLGRLLAQLQCKEEAMLGELTRPFDSNPLYQAVYAVADEALKQRLTQYCQKVNRNAAEIRYQRGCDLMRQAVGEKDYADAAYWFGAARKYQPDHPDAGEKMEFCLQQVKTAEKTEIEQPIQPVVQISDENHRQEEQVLADDPAVIEKTPKPKKKKWKKNVWNFVWLILSLPFTLLTVAGFFTYDGEVVQAFLFAFCMILAALFWMLFAAPAGTPYLSGEGKGLKKWHLFPICIRGAFLIFELYVVGSVWFNVILK